MIGNELGGFREGRGCVDQIFTLKQRGEIAREKKLRVYVGLDLNVYDRVNVEALKQVLRIYDVGNTFLNEIQSNYVNSLACVRVKRGVSEC